MTKSPSEFRFNPFVEYKTKSTVDAPIKTPILIISEFYLPIENPAVNRVVSWCRHLGKYGLYPIVFTLGQNGRYHNEVQDGYEVHYFPFRESLFERLAQQFMKKVNITVIRRLFRLMDALLTDYSWYNPLKVLVGSAAIETAKLKQPRCILATAPGYASFGVANSIAKKLNVQWIADYRDDWTSTKVRGSFKSSVRLKDRFYEKWLLSRSAGFTTVSEHYVKTIGELINKPGWLVENGFEMEEVPVNLIKDRTQGGANVVLVYPGRLYKSQQLELLASCLGSLDEECRNELQIIFLGSDLDITQLPEQLCPLLGKCLHFQPRIPQTEALEFLSHADALLFIGHTTHTGEPIKGVPGSKLYHFIMLRKPVLMIPSDQDIALTKLSKTGQAINIREPSDFISFIKRIRQAKKMGRAIIQNPTDPEVYYSNTREAQAGKLADVIFRVI